DEPTVGLDPKQVAEIRDLIKELRGEHTIILSTHILSEVQATCNKVIIIHEGKIVAQDSIEKLERMNQGSIMLTLKVRNSKEALTKAIRNIEGVNDIEMITSQHYRINMIEQDDLIEKIASEVIRSGAGLIELSPGRAQLEDVFLKLTYGQNS
ncbi:MAG: ABC transporter ATP-binding protein, partial [Bdellovibrionaceae bacterium]|nr:ABC transporter ATP-binding protein [Bdellovibrio sp.]